MYIVQSLAYVCKLTMWVDGYNLKFDVLYFMERLPEAGLQYFHRLKSAGFRIRNLCIGGINVETYLGSILKTSQPS
jgi:hypothetical protein